MLSHFWTLRPSGGRTRRVSKSGQMFGTLAILRVRTACVDNESDVRTLEFKSPPKRSRTLTENIPAPPASDWSAVRIYPRFLRPIGCCRASGWRTTLWATSRRATRRSPRRPWT
eukprot:8365713-Pyramimonas_sp.AAC.1